MANQGAPPQLRGAMSTRIGQSSSTLTNVEQLVKVFLDDADSKSKLLHGTTELMEEAGVESARQVSLTC